MKKKVLILDDDYEIHRLVLARLEGTPFEIVSAYTAEEAIERLKSERFDCFLIDIVLQNNQSSDEVVRYLKNSTNSLNWEVPLLVMSAHMNANYADSIRMKNKMILNTIKKPLPKDLNLEILIEDTILAATFLKEGNQIPA